MPEWLRIAFGVGLLILISAGPALLYEYFRLEQSHATQGKRPPTEYRPADTSSHDHDTETIYHQPPPPETATATEKAQTPELQKSTTENRRTDLGNKGDGMDNLSAWATVAVTIGLLIVATVQA